VDNLSFFVFGVRRVFIFEPALISLGDVQGTPLAEMSLQDLERPIATAMRTQFPTSRAAARHMIKQKSGVILMFGGDGPRCRTTPSEASR
jgi:hypothetical protein